MDTPPSYFLLEDLMLKPSDPTLQYTRSKAYGKEAIYIPTWKEYRNLLSELWFFSQFGDPVKHNGTLVIYVGAADQIHLPVLIQLLPWIKQWHLYDTRHFSYGDGSSREPTGVRPEWINRVHIYSGKEGEFTNQTAKEWT
mgnify:CR=1 FL=1